MKLQLALDLLDLEGAGQLLEKVADLVDIAEVGTPLILREGVRAIAAIKQAGPGLEVLADLKIMDAGEHESRMGFEAGADIVTVLGAARDTTIRSVLEQAQVHGRKVMVDLIAVPDAPARARQIDEMGADYICVHTAADVQAEGEDPLQELHQVHPVLQCARMAVAGGIDSRILPQIAAYEPEIIVVGGFITKHSDPRLAALELRDLFPQGNIS